MTILGVFWASRGRIWTKIGRNQAEALPDQKSILGTVNYYLTIVFDILFIDSRHIQLANYTVFDEEFDVQIENEQTLEPEGKT